MAAWHDRIFPSAGQGKVSPTYLLRCQSANLRTHFYREPPMGIPIIVEERFDTFSLARHIKNIGRAYQRQAIELVNICRMFVEKYPPEKRHNAIPKLTTFAIVEALRSATVAGKSVTDKASAAFQDAKVKLLRYRAIMHPGLQSMDAMIAERMAQAKEKDERSLELFNQLLKKRGPNETSTLPEANERIHMGHTDSRVDTEAQVARSPIAVTPSEASYTPSASVLTHVPSPTCVKVEEGQRQRSSVDHRHTPSSPHTLTHRASLAFTSRKRPTAGSCSTITTSPAPQAPGASGSLETPTHRSSSTTVSPTIQQSSFEYIDPRGTGPHTIPKRPESMSLPPSDMPPHLPASPSSHSSPPTARTDPPSNSIDVAPTVSPERRNEITQHSSNSLPRPGEKKISSIHVQTMIKTSTRAGINQKQSAKFAPFSLSPSPPGPPGTRREAHSRLKMPGAFPGTSLDDVDVDMDVDVSSWVLVDSVSPDCRVENSNRSWFKRMFSRFG